MKVKKVFQATDRRTFDSQEEAEAYQQNVFTEWLGRRPSMDLKEVWDAMPEESEDEYYASPKDLALGFLETAFRLCHEGAKVTFAPEECDATSNV